MVVLLMGVTGVGKTTVGVALARELQWRFADADDFHSPANVAKMRAGIPLNDADRAPWLQALHDAIVGWLDGNESVVLACSALKAAYREQLLVSPAVKLIYLHGDAGLLAERLRDRHGHYMNSSLLQSQFDTLEEPQNAISVDVGKPAPAIVAEIRTALGV